MQNDIYTKLREAIRASGISQVELAQKTGMQQASISRFIKGTQGLSAEYVLSLIGFLNGQIVFPTSLEEHTIIRRPGQNAPVEVVEGEALPKVPVMGEVGAGNEIDIFETIPECFISVLPRYYRKDLITLKVAGDSMAPTICMGDYVGIIPFDGTLHEGGIYLIDLPPFGRVVKRVRMGKDGEIILLSDNPSYGERIIPYEGYEKLVVGQVCWIMQKCWEF